MRHALALGFTAALVLAPLLASGGTILDTRHNLSVAGPGAIKAQSETRICVFCHTPHSGNPKTPLWNKTIESGTNYFLYGSSTLQASPAQPSGPSRLCLSCHDGLTALGAVRRPAGGISMNGAILPGSPAGIGTGGDLTKDHPLSFSYPGASLAFKPKPGDDKLLLYGGFIECPTCHDAHQDVYRSPDTAGRLTGKFLVVANRFSALCLDCHDLPGWSGTAHQTSATLVDPAAFPKFPKQWPTWTTVAEWGCESCHTAHSSQSGVLLLDRYESTDPTIESNLSYALCYRCHNRLSLLADGAFQKKTVRTTPSGGGHSGHLDKNAPCVACHDTHGTPAAAGTGDHTHLVDFDLTIATAAPGYSAPIYQHQGIFAGNCTLICHGRTHLNESYP